MSIALTKAVKDIQVFLHEVGLYQSGFDGVWGGGSSRATQSLFNAYAARYGKANPLVIPASSTAEEVVKQVQTALKGFSLYSGKVDGIWGAGSRNGFKTLTDDYRRNMNLPSYGPCWSIRVSDEFTARCRKWVEDRGLVEECLDYLLAIMCFETAGTFRPDIRNSAGANYWGLIQFGTAAATDLGTTLDKLKVMTQMQQLEYVFKYFDMRMKAYKLRSLEDFYMSVFYPAAIGKSPDTVLFKQGSTGYRQNSGLDVNKDGNITVGEISVKIYKTYYDGMQVSNRRKING